MNKNFKTKLLQTKLLTTLLATCLIATSVVSLPLSAHCQDKASQDKTAQDKVPPVTSNTDESEITVSAGASVWAQPDTIRISFLLQETGNSTSAALKSIETKATSLATALSQASGETLKLYFRSQKISGGDIKKPQITAGSPVSINRVVGVELSDLTKVGLTIDSALKSGATAIVDIRYTVENAEKERSQAIALATEKAKKKAENVAKNLGLKLGAMRLVSLSEEPLGQTFGDQVKNGSTNIDYDDQTFSVYVSLSFTTK